MPRLIWLRWCGVAILLASSAVWSQAVSTGSGQAYPNKPIRMVVPFAAGGPSDVVIRMVGQKLTEAWGQTMVIDNRGGAGGNIGVSLVAKSAPDGYTLVLASMHFVVNPSLYRSAGYDAEKDFTAVTNIAISPVIIAAHPSLAARDPRELAQIGKRNTIDYGSRCTGTAGHLAGELFNTVAGIKMQHIPYKGAAPAFADLLGAQIKLAITAMPIATPVRQGRPTARDCRHHPATLAGFARCAYRRRIRLPRIFCRQYVRRTRTARHAERRTPWLGHCTRPSRAWSNNRSCANG